MRELRLLLSEFSSGDFIGGNCVLIQVSSSSFGPQSFIELGWDHAQNTPPLFEHPDILKIAEKTKKTPAQVLLRQVIFLLPFPSLYPPSTSDNANF